MGYAIFTARKLMLTNRINQLNARRLQLSQQQMTLADNAAKLERAMANTRNIFSNIGNIFQMNNTMMQNVAFNELTERARSGEIDQTESIALYQQFQQQFNFAASAPGMMLSMMNQTLETQQSTQLQRIKDMETQIELQAKSIETQIQAAQKELEAVEKAEEKNIERSAPKFA